MADKLIYKGGTTVVGSTGGMRLMQPKAGSFSKFPRWWNKKGGQYIDCAIFLVTLDNGCSVRLVVPATDRMTLEIRHDGLGNFMFPACRIDRIAVVATDSTEILVEYQFSKISGGSVLKRSISALPKPEVFPEVEVEEPELEVKPKKSNKKKTVVVKPLADAGQN
tara:strand:- start:873 stop:1367 length:495 start_codon:yes stop_codon:yes gene_type:complete